MNDYSDLIFLIAAIAIYGLLVNNTTRSLVLNNQILNDSEIEYGAISLAQDILEEVRWIKYADLDKNELENLFDRPLYQDIVTIQQWSAPPCPALASCKKVSVEIKSNFLKNEDNSYRSVTMSMIKTDY